MGRKPNPIISEYFTRGPKLSDSSNRYPHTCKLCGENFPKGRGEVLHRHITEKCPAISPEDRINAALGFAGLHSGHCAGANMVAPPQHTTIDLSTNQLHDSVAPHIVASEAPETWSALRTLAEASRQVGANELSHPKPEDIPDSHGDHRRHHTDQDVLHLQEQFTLENPPPTYDATAHRDGKDDESNPLHFLTTEEKLEHLKTATQHPAVSSEDSAGLAAAAAARLNHSLLLDNIYEQASHETNSASPVSEHVRDHNTPPVPQANLQPIHQSSLSPSQQPGHLSPRPQLQHPWGQMSYVAPQPANGGHVPVTLSAPIRGGTRMSIGNGTRSEHKRKAYTPSRRKEVQAARKKGACIRCRILRKVCGLNDPCDQCRKIQGPRHWTYPCVRTHLNQVLSLYSAGLIVVLAQNRVNQARNAYQLMQIGTSLRVSLWSDSIPMSLSALVTASPMPNKTGDAEPSTDDKNGDSQNSSAPSYQIVMIDQDKEDLPARMETYLKDVLPILIEREPSHFMRVVLSFAQKVENYTGDLVKRAIELWGLVEILDRERSWCIVEERDGRVVSRGPEDGDAGIDQETYSLMTWQLSAAAERKANAVSHKLISELQRTLENGKIALHFDVYLAILILLHCLEKTTWTIKVWEMEDFRQRWPLERPPHTFTNQGHEIADLLKMLLTLRKVHPKTARAPDGQLVVSETRDPVITNLFEALNLRFDEVVDRLEHCAFSPESSRSLEFHFSGLVLLPQREPESSSQPATFSSPGATTPQQNGSVHP
ncbi:hypothetical protein SODALDRAFT_167626 [Sodiomyces alkalinus F11]|uniref:Zn(2)-C6 fungal-type domain-containing protein n=1 Tax=Sodiomyces alkalinus (strain CBS 110278 / VKM F-3762 / F11) TaxID=1314773 RepID=A0A3N2PVX4_SODAK|nr:hypothetical protein SODALDRAFT_167626 [Sodiomyces alkalinus F11]ROT38647.1 hypothetical protein SODALDRAFT_167626 [Sodiomyces alkalinus F11]